MNKLNLSDLLLSNFPPPPETVYEELKKVFSFVKASNTNDPLFNMQFVCSDDEEQIKLVIQYGYSLRTGRWFYNPIAAKDFED